MNQGRRVWRFVNNSLGAPASANLFFLVVTARVNGIEAGAYLNFRFENLPAAETLDFEPHSRGCLLGHQAIGRAGRTRDS